MSIEFVNHNLLCYMIQLNSGNWESKDGYGSYYVMQEQTLVDRLEELR